MPLDANGQPLEVITNDLGVISRTNPAQIVEGLLGKIAAMTGKHYDVTDFEDIRDMAKFAESEARKHGISGFGFEDLTDPETDKRIKDVFVGNRYFMKLHHTAECYDEQTEVLTEFGWRKWANVSPGWRLATVRGNQLTYEKPLELIRRTYNGEMLSFSGRYLDYVVTPNHRMWIRGYGWQEEWDFRMAEEVHGQRFRVRQFGFEPDTRWAGPRTAIFGDTVIDWDAYCELVGWWATEGYAKVTPRRACVLIYQSETANPEKFQQLEQLVRSLPFPWHYYKVKGEKFGIGISSRELAIHLKQYGTHSENKRLPRDVISGPISGRWRLYKAMMLGDGNEQETATGPRARLSTTSPGLADDFQELCVRIGLGAIVRPCKPRKETKYLPAYECGVALSRRIAQVDGDRNKAGFKRIPYSGTVYCATMATGLLYVRRNGKPMLCGNSKGQGRGTGGYTMDDTPAKGGEQGSKRISLLDNNALLSHGAIEVLRDAGAIRGQKNDDFWLTYMQGHTPPTPKVPMIYQRFVNELKAAGINVVPDGSQIHIMALTGDDVKKMTGGRYLRNAETLRFEKGMKPIDGGLFDPTLTGGRDGNRWAAIKLDEPMPNPVMEEPIRRLLGLTVKKFEDVLAGKEKIDGHTGPGAISRALSRINVDNEIDMLREQIRSGRKTVRADAVKKLGYLKSAQRLGIHPKEWMLDEVPVLPPMFRRIAVMSDTKLPLVADANYLYKELFEANQNLSELQQEVDDVGDERLAVYNAFKAVTGLGDPVHPKLQERRVQGILKTIFGSSPKFGSVQRRLVSSTVDLVGRAVITPNPDLDMDHVGLPENRAWDLYKVFVIRRLRRRGMPGLEAAKQFENRSSLARSELLNEMEERPVIINRAPVLHRFGIMAFRPKLVKGDTLQVSPLVVGGFNADFDGDAMQYHVPFDDKAREEALDRMLPSRNLLSPADFKSPMHVPRQEYVGGLYHASTARDDVRRPRVFRNINDLRAAFKRGEVDLSDRIEVLE